MSLGFTISTDIGLYGHLATPWFVLTVHNHRVRGYWKRTEEDRHARRTG